MTEATTNLEGRVRMGRNDYGNIEFQAKHNVKPTEISEALYWYLLNVLPPIHGPGGSYFMCEFYTGNITLQFVKIGRRCFAKYVEYGNKITYIESHYLDQSYPLDPKDAVGYADA